MKKMILILAMALFLISCERKLPPSYVNYRITNALDNMEVVRIEECEYIVLLSRNAYGPVISITHKGNCKNPIHHNKGELE